MANVDPASDMIYELWRSSSGYTNVSYEVDHWPLRKGDAMISFARNSLVQEGLRGASLCRYWSTSQWAWKAEFGVGLLCVTITTFLITSLKSWIAVQSIKQERMPPVVPYWVPFLRNLVPFVWDPARFFDRVT